MRGAHPELKSDHQVLELPQLLPQPLMNNPNQVKLQHHPQGCRAAPQVLAFVGSGLDLLQGMGVACQVGSVGRPGALGPQGTGARTEPVLHLSAACALP